MNKDDSLDLHKSVEYRNQKVKRSASLFMLSNVAFEDSVAQEDDRNEISDFGNQAPKRRHKSLPLSFIPTNEENEEMPKLELSPSASMNFGVNRNYSFEAENANDKIINDLLEINFNSPGPRAPIRQASSKSLLDLDEDLSINGTESLEIERYFEAGHEKKSPSSSPKASSSKIESAEKKIADKEK